MTKSALISSVVVSAIASFTVACGAGNRAPATNASQANAVSVTLANAQGQSVGTATLTPAATGVRIALAVSGLSAGEHAVHVHQTALCEGPAFTSAGGHFNPDQKRHGLNNPDGPHAGDMPNFTVDASGRSSATIVAPGVTLDEGPRSVFTGGGTALVIHEKADDMRSDPAGNAGARIACGVIKR